ncbi:hypothetical protein DPMN_089513 [Dreissena polymorpha]|uniref:Uncharacterized protein n=1 Tax=Dreissena polymorpha TaxID=45954 RepID=A0A9D4KYG1_DREPO|nr:hypothetical protein DPMN_089513 [Dreissena polymorpha]
MAAPMKITTMLLLQVVSAYSGIFDGLHVHNMRANEEANLSASTVSMIDTYPLKSLQV